MESKSPLGGNLPGGLIFTSPAPVLITKTEGTARLSLNDLAENRHIFPQFSCAASVGGYDLLRLRFPGLRCEAMHSTG